MFFKRKPDALDDLKRKLREDQEKTDDAYERLFEALSPSERLQETINKAVRK